MILKNATVVRWHPPSVERKTLDIGGGEVVDLGGRVVVPGMVCAHTHLYSALVRGMRVPPTRDFKEILEKIWWKLDRALDLDAIESSAAVGALDAVACGTTTLFDHHASPAAIEGSLDRVRHGIEMAGARAVLCYEVTDRGGPDEARRGLAEHRAFQPDARFRVAVGAHAAFTLEPATVRACADLARELGTGVHVHAAEDPVDASPIERLRPVLGPRTILAHGVHLTAQEVEAARECWFVHNPRSNMNNRVGYASRLRERTALGTDGIGADMFAEARFAFFKARDAGRAIDVLRMLQTGVELAAQYFGRLDDYAVLDYDPPTPLTADTLAGHLVFGMEARHVSSVIVGGEFVMRERRFAKADPAKVMETARARAARLWERSSGPA